MIVAVIVLSVAVVLLLVLALCYERELRSVARFLGGADDASNQRLTVELRTPGTVKAASAVNGLIDDQGRVRREVEGERRRFREDMAALSHDVRTPLAGAQGYLQLYGFEDDPDERERCVSEARARLAAMKELVDQLFEYTKARDPGCEPREGAASVYDAVVEAFASLYPSFAGKGWEPAIDFEDEALAASADADDLVRVFSNLAANCLQHGSSAPTVVQRGRTVAVSNCVDDPAAIDEGRLFSRFYRADASRGSAGSGLGLAIVASLCERMGATARASIEGDVLTVEIEFAR